MTSKEEIIQKKELLSAFSSFDKNIVVDFLDKNSLFVKKNKAMIIYLNENTIKSPLIIEKIIKIETKLSSQDSALAKKFEIQLIKKSDNLEEMWKYLPYKHQLKILSKYQYTTEFTSEKIGVLTENFIFYKEEKKIINWLSRYNIKNYELIPDEKYGFVVNCYSTINLYKQKLFHIPVKFNIVKELLLHNNHLISLEFCPHTVNDRFVCSENNLTSLKGCPQEVHGYFLCSNNKLTSLDYLPTTLTGIFECKNNPQLNNLQYIEDFTQLKKEIKKLKVVKDFSNKLENELIDNTIPKKSNKIKI